MEEAARPFPRTGSIAEEKADPEGDPAAAISALADRYQKGAGDALAPLHEALRPAIAGALARYRRRGGFPPSITPEDLAQQTWVILADLARRWKPSGSFLAYFLRSFPREIHRYYGRSLPNRRTRTAQMLTLPHDDLLIALDRRAGVNPSEEPGPLTDALMTLPPDQRVALVLRAVEGFDYREIGRALGVSHATAHRLYRRAVAALSTLT